MCCRVKPAVFKTKSEQGKRGEWLDGAKDHSSHSTHPYGHIAPLSWAGNPPGRIRDYHLHDPPPICGCLGAAWMLVHRAHHTCQPAWLQTGHFKGKSLLPQSGPSPCSKLMDLAVNGAALRPAPRCPTRSSKQQVEPGEMASTPRPNLEPRGCFFLYQNCN